MKKKILFPFYGKSYGGAHISTINFVKYLKKNSNYDPVIVLNYKGKFYNYLKKRKIKFVYLKINTLLFQKKGFLFNLSSLFNFYKISSKFIKNNNIKIVHGNTFSENLSWSIVCKIKKINFVWHQRSLLKAQKLNFFFKYLSSFCLSNSKSTLKSLPYHPIKKITYNVFDNSVKKIKKNKVRFKLGCLARIHPNKKIEDLIDILKILVETNRKRKVNLLIAGEILDKKYYQLVLKKIKILNLSKHIKIVNFMNINHFFSKIDFLISARDDEAFGRTLVESYLFRTPYLVTKLEGHKEINNFLNGGLFYRKNNISSIISSFNELNSKTYIRKYSKNHNLKKIQKYFGEKQYKIIINLYEKYC